MLDFNDHTRTGTSILTSAADMTLTYIPILFSNPTKANVRSITDASVRLSTGGLPLRLCAQTQWMGEDPATEIQAALWEAAATGDIPLMGLSPLAGRDVRL